MFVVRVKRVARSTVSGPLGCFGAMRLAMTKVEENLRSPQAGIQWAAFRLCEMIWVPAFAGSTEKPKQGPHPTLSHRERAKRCKALAPLGERVG